MRVAGGGTEIALTASIGVATLEGNDSADELVARADTALYRAKRAGRNRCVAIERDANPLPKRALDDSPQSS
jgi:diguanylate cyclase (GGDEF)-like protein